MYSQHYLSRYDSYDEMIAAVFGENKPDGFESIFEPGKWHVELNTNDARDLIEWLDNHTSVHLSDVMRQQYCRLTDENKTFEERRISEYYWRWTTVILSVSAADMTAIRLHFEDWPERRK